VQEAFDELGFVLLQADLTDDSDPVVQQLYREYQIRGLPAIVFLDQRGDELRDLRLTGYEKPEDFAARLRCVPASAQARRDS
jgi:thiol:disulfide interchange protein DsbD